MGDVSPMRGNGGMYPTKIERIETKKTNHHK
jgi:hypothetical protein